MNDCNFTNNISYQGGSAIYIYDSNATFTNCVFIQNSTLSGSGKGGAGYLEDSNVTISDSVFDQNEAYHDGGAIFIFNTATHGGIF